QDQFRGGASWWSDGNLPPRSRAPPVGPPLRAPALAPRGRRAATAGLAGGLWTAGADRGRRRRRGARPVPSHRRLSTAAGAAASGPRYRLGHELGADGAGRPAVEPGSAHGFGDGDRAGLAGGRAEREISPRWGGVGQAPGPQRELGVAPSGPGALASRVGPGSGALWPHRTPCRHASSGSLGPG